eukprot:GHRQ01033963.1.p2 GENE.GHRQ01033963.1~~GHRQ01033963.1.p2  ORF type:complete len:489 (+),score=180.62 GHRQ01033963.1:1689-3155(+)
MFYPPQNKSVDTVLRQGITFAKGSYWTGLRGALQPLFHSHGLKSYQPLVEAAVEQLAADLAPAADSGASMDMHAAMCNVALKAIGEAAFGVKLQTQEVVDGQIRENVIVKAATYALENTAKTLTFMLLPPLLKPVLYPLIRRFPPQRLRGLNTARMQLFTAALTLAKNAMTRLGLPWQDEVNMTDKFDCPETRPLREKYGVMVPAQGSVVDLLVRAKDKQTGQPLKAHQVVAQVRGVALLPVTGAGNSSAGVEWCALSGAYCLAAQPGKLAAHRMKRRTAVQAVQCSYYHHNNNTRSSHSINVVSQCCNDVATHCIEDVLLLLPFLLRCLVQVNSILVAGHDTTSFMLTSTLYWVATSPEVKAKVFAEIERFGRQRQVTHDDMDKFPYLEAVLQESLRLSPPGWMTSREAQEDITLNGIFIPKGSVVYIDIIGIQRSPKYWQQPLSFMPERFLDKVGRRGRPTRRPLLEIGGYHSGAGTAVGACSSIL